MNEAMQKLIDAVQNASPVVWQAAYRQAWIDGIENILLALLFVSIARLCWNWRKKFLANDDDAGEPGPVLTAIAVIAALLIAVPFIVSAIDCFSNPTFAAIKNLKGLL